MILVLSEKILDINLKYLTLTENGTIQYNTTNKIRVKLNWSLENG